MRKLFLSILLLLVATTINAQSIFGEWENRNEKTNTVDSVIKVYEKDGKAFAKIIEITNKDKQKSVCDKCSGNRKNTPILGMNILTGLKKDGNEWSGGTIVDPKNGKEYKCYIELENADKLKIRGYIGFAVFGRTAYWYRKK
ncbi:DUF2147 domain-containing protein [Tenacibaculum finnmarkense]|uniref:DUF2147 domain-containing protein n=1 Tax=Tenacibaculum finnmarkense TaxID=2781243 RepID=UPI000C3FDF72|nr:DUF2147 domain-containing protein [Tenacibaculum finnmarkense]MDB0615265.1 DUF2147 domain-containing protein [Tenacibaculum dicentrarchi]MCD8403311.1 DUF2147 domain-containing protein [Tenacibaculum finnmarkense genomovar finnmarkense]MCD8439187.1 DUF2147 domain-containing protein [Tenacibaculum finnmarkense genomovar ulcerans]WCC45302.1 DUF2147 domain-containing protein [Tenacibaculum finnmarkense]SOS55564.1 conserved exported hypothetical protein [Tenacibaculum finnmarkense]